MTIGVVVGLLAGFGVASGWIRWAFERSARKDSEGERDKARADASDARDDLADREQRIRLYLVQLATYRRQVRELADDVAACADPGVVRSRLNRLLSDPDGDPPSTGSAVVPGGDGTGASSDAIWGDLR